MVRQMQRLAQVDVLYTYIPFIRRIYAYKGPNKGIYAFTTYIYGSCTLLWTFYTHICPLYGEYMRVKRRLKGIYAYTCLVYMREYTRIQRIHMRRRKWSGSCCVWLSRKKKVEKSCCFWHIFLLLIVWHIFLLLIRDHELKSRTLITNPHQRIGPTPPPW